MSRFKALIFDLDGTLIDTYQGLLHSLNFVLRSFALEEVDLVTLKKLVGRGLEDLIRRSVGESRLKEGIVLFRSHYSRTHLEGSFLMPYVHETLQELQSLAIKMAVASNKPAEFSESLLAHLGIHSFFIQCCGPNQEIKPKPHPDMLQFVMKALAVTRAETLYVGDMPLDVESARNAGVAVVLIPTGGYDEQQLRESRPDFLLEDFRGLTWLIADNEAI